MIIIIGCSNMTNNNKIVGYTEETDYKINTGRPYNNIELILLKEGNENF